MSHYPESRSVTSLPWFPYFLSLAAEKIDLDKVDLNKLRVKQLRKIMQERGLTCEGCLEKGDFIRTIEESLGRREEL